MDVNERAGPLSTRNAAGALVPVCSEGFSRREALAVCHQAGVIGSTPEWQPIGARKSMGIRLTCRAGSTGLAGCSATPMSCVPVMLHCQRAVSG
jgi:hypothetical protein